MSLENEEEKLKRRFKMIGYFNLYNAMTDIFEDYAGQGFSDEELSKLDALTEQWREYVD